MSDFPLVFAARPPPTNVCSKKFSDVRQKRKELENLPTELSAVSEEERRIELLLRRKSGVVGATLARGTLEIVILRMRRARSLSLSLSDRGQEGNG